MMKRYPAFVLPLLLAACGNAPSKTNVEDALNRPAYQLGGSTSAILVKSSSCTAQEDEVYRCKVIASQDGMGGTHVIEFKIINDQWNVVDHVT